MPNYPGTSAHEYMEREAQGEDYREYIRTRARFAPFVPHEEPAEPDVDVIEVPWTLDDEEQAEREDWIREEGRQEGKGVGPVLVLQPERFGAYTVPYRRLEAFDGMYLPVILPGETLDVRWATEALKRRYPEAYRTALAAYLNARDTRKRHTPTRALTKA